MATLSEWMNRLRYLGRRSRFENDLDVEVRFHIESRAEELIASGLSRRDAVTRARAEFGSIARAAEDSRAAWQFRWIEDLAGDQRYGFRTLRRNPAFAVTAVVSLALGIGANAAVFNALYTVIWKPLPVSKPERLVSFSIRHADGLESGAPLAFDRQLRSAGVFDGISVISADGLSFSYDDRAERVMGEVVSANCFSPMAGRSIRSHKLAQDPIGTSEPSPGLSRPRASRRRIPPPTCNSRTSYVPPRSASTGKEAASTLSW
jgi:hypothetical protein